MSGELEQAIAGGLIKSGGGDDGAAEAAAADAEREAEQDLQAEQEAAYDRIFNGEDKPAGDAKPETAEESEASPELETEAAEPEAAAEDKPASETVAAPEHWSQPDKDRFSKLPDDARQWWLDKTKQLESGYQEKFKGAAEMRKQVEDIDHALHPLDQIIQQHGISRADAVARLVGADQLLRQNIGQGLSAIVKGYGRSLAGSDQARAIVRQIAQDLGVGEAGATGGGDQGKTDPEIEELKRTVHEMRSQAEAQRDQDLAQRRADAQRHYETFRDAKDDGGAPKHPHLEAVKVEMAALMGAARQAGSPIDLEAAYERAVWSRPELREALTKAQQEAAVKAADDARRSKVAKATAAGTPQTKSAPGRHEDPLAGKTLREAHEDAYDRNFGS